MINKDFETKLKKMRDVYTLPEDQRLLDETEKKIRDNIAKSELAENPNVIPVLEDSGRRVKEITILLAFDMTLTEAQRLALDKERAVHQFYLDRFGIKSVLANLDSIDKWMDSKL